jgi:hypothetical protein
MQFFQSSLIFAGKARPIQALSWTPGLTHQYYPKLKGLHWRDISKNVRRFSKKEKKVLYS